MNQQSNWHDECHATLLQLQKENPENEGLKNALAEWDLFMKKISVDEAQYQVKNYHPFTRNQINFINNQIEKAAEILTSVNKCQDVIKNTLKSIILEEENEH